jgi:hypothetical protein
MLIIFEKIISINECNFWFTNIKVVRTISSTMKSSMEILLFLWSQVSKHPELKPMIDAWFERFKVSINLNIFLYSTNTQDPNTSSGILRVSSVFIYLTKIPLVLTTIFFFFRIPQYIESKN